MIPTGMQYFATIQGNVWKVVCCEYCSTTYGYRMEVSATGSGSSFLFLNNEGARAVAHLMAQERFLRKAERKIAPVPCPVCGFYQKSMQKILRRRIHWAHVVGLFLLVASALFLVDPDLWLIGVVPASLGIVLLITGFVARFRLNPNAGNPEPRKKLGQSHAAWGENLIRLINK